MFEHPQSFGAELRTLRIAAGLSLTQFADKIHYSKGYISRIETGGKPPNKDFARRCDAILDADGRLAALVPTEQLPIGQAANATDGDDEWTLDRTLDGTRQPGHATDEMTIGIFQQQFGESIRLGELLASSVVLPVVIAQANALWRLAIAAPRTTRTSLTLLAALNTTYAGWLALEAGDDHLARRWSRTAVRIASMIDNADLLAYTLIREAQVAIYRDDPVETLALATRAQRIPGVSPHFLGVAAHREAQGYALAGDYNLCQRALDRATPLLFHVSASPTIGGSPLPPLAGGGSHIGGAAAGWCLHALGRSRQAAEMLDQELVRMDKTHRRAVARYGARRVLAYAAAGEVDHACGLAHELLEVGRIVDSACTRLELRQLARTLARWHNHQPVRELNARLNAAIQLPARQIHHR